MDRRTVLWMAWYGLPPLVMAAFVFWLSSQTGADLESSGLPRLLGRYTDEAAHALLYFVLCALLTRAFIAWHDSKSGGQRVVSRVTALGLLAIVAASAYGAADELYQSTVPGRTPDIRDLLVDAAGATAGALAYTAFYLILRQWRDRSRLGRLLWSTR